MICELFDCVVPCTITHHLDFDGAWQKHGSLAEVSVTRLME